MRTLACVFLAAAAVRADDPKPVEFAGLKSTPPKTWKEETPANTMRTHQFKLPKAEGEKEDAELALFYFKAGSGSLEANLKRQQAKFQPADGKDKIDEKVEKIKVGTVEATYQDISGTYLKKPFPMAEKATPFPGYRQLYVVFETKDGQFYMTLIGSAKTVENHKKGFEEWLKNFK
jgi:hypothetical protein